MTRPLKVLHVNTEPTWRGGEQQVLYLLDGLRARGVASVLAAQPDGPMAERARKNGHQVVGLRMRGEVDPVAVWKLYRLLRRGGFTVVHAHTSHAHTLIVLAAALFGRSPLRPKVVVARRVDFSIYRRSFFGLNGLKYRHGVDGYVTVSEAIRQVLIQDGLPPERIVTVHSGIDLKRIEDAPDQRDAIRASLQVPAGHALIANVAHLADHKGQRYLLEALPAILAARPDVTCAIVGDGELKEELQALAAKLGVTHAVRFPGFRTDIPTLLKALDVFVMPSHMEGLGTSVLDAMAAGAPVVGTAAGGMPEAIEHEVTGLVCPIKDAPALATAILRVLNDPALAAKFKENGQRRVRERFSTDAMVDGTVQAYARIAEGALAPPPARGAARLIPLYRPHLAAMGVLLAASLLYASADAARTKLVAPLINDVLLRGGDAKGQVKDEYFARHADAALVTSGEAVAIPTTDEVERLRRDPGLGLSPAAVVPGARVERGPLEAPPSTTLADLWARLRSVVGVPLAETERMDAATSAQVAFERTRRALRRAADDPDLKPGDAAAWEKLALAARLQASAEAMVLATPSPDAVALASAAEVSLEARRKAWDVSFGHAFDTLKRILAWAIGLALLIAAGHYATFYLARKLTAILYVDLQRRLARHLLGLSLRFFETERRGDLLSRLTTDLGLVANVITSQCDLVVQLIRLTVLGAVAVWTSLPLTLVLASGAVFVVLPLRRWGRKQRRASRRRQGAAGDVFESVQQMVSGIRVVKGFQREEHELLRFDRRVEETTLAQIDAVRTRELAKSFMQLVNDLAVPALFLLGAFVVVERWWDLDAGTFGSFLGLILLMYLPARAVGEAWTTFNDALPSVDRVFQLLDVKPEVTDAKDAVSPPIPLRTAVTFEDVSFRYGPGTPEVLAGISFTAPVGSLTALVGHTGAGKSTLVDLLSRTHDPTGGRVLVDGVDLRRIKLGEWLDRLAVVPQQGFLFNDTIRENIRYGRLEATRDEIEEAAKLAELHEEVAARYDDLVGDRGSKLSGGQVQRLALARAIVKGPDILILDEATNKLDTKTEKLVQRALAKIAEQTTTFVVAHRLSTITMADLILVLDKGTIVQRGTHEELKDQPGPYAELLRSQAIDRPADSGEGPATGGEDPQSSGTT